MLILKVVLVLLHCTYFFSVFVIFINNLCFLYFNLMLFYLYLCMWLLILFIHYAYISTSLHYHKSIGRSKLGTKYATCIAQKCRLIKESHDQKTHEGKRFMKKIRNYEFKNSISQVAFCLLESSCTSMNIYTVGNPMVPEALRAGVWEGLFNGSHTANAPLLICSPVTILRKPCNKQTCLTY